MFLCAVVMAAASAEARLLRFNWDVKEELDPMNMKVLTVNGETPCPNIQAQQGDIIDVKVTNNLQEELAIRWQRIKQVYIASHLGTVLCRSCGRVFDEDRRSWIKLQIGTPPCEETNGFILAGGTCTYRLVADQVSSVNTAKDRVVSTGSWVRLKGRSSR